jgi:hypothetical protein
MEGSASGHFSSFVAAATKLRAGSVEGVPVKDALEVSRKLARPFAEVRSNRQVRCQKARVEFL